MLELNFWAVLLCAILSMVLGFIWYGPLFGKKWMAVMNAEKMNEEEKKKMMKSAWKLYLIQFILTLFELYVLAWYIGTLSGISSGIHTAFSIWLAFLVPTLAGSVMWSGDKKKVAWNRFLIQAGYQLILFLLTGFILTIRI